MESPRFQLEAPFFMLLSAPSHAGKSTFCRRLLEHSDEMISPPPTHFVWCYSIAQSWMGELVPKVTFHQGLCDFNTLPPNTLAIADDLQDALSAKDSKIATRLSHHKFISVVYITQNLFFKGGAHRDLSLNANYICLMKNPRDQYQASVLARQLYPKKTDYFMKSLADATKNPYSYLLICLRQTTPEFMRLVTNIFPGEKLAIYMPAES